MHVLHIKTAAGVPAAVLRSLRFLLFVSDISRKQRANAGDERKDRADDAITFRGVGHDVLIHRCIHESAVLRQLRVCGRKTD